MYHHYQQTVETNKKNGMQKFFLWLIVVDYALLTLFLTQLSSLTLRGGTGISLLLVIYNVLLTFLCFQRTRRRDTYIIYPTLSATLLAFICFLYFFFLI
ncbi:hypothetical protein [Vibrio quintilis]|uniref:Uncharacterized protein n=2 Tax=Vibrio quintilis TaxID=1117707 RepID=A0A1M7YST3_9VIBR|nr:hypothetical protein [Vibrio quintilis]SHO55678.1 hypothetical protein VQ7734_01424 [Vibrio quintilis]